MRLSEISSFILYSSVTRTAKNHQIPVLMSTARRQRDDMMHRELPVRLCIATIFASVACLRPFFLRNFVP